MATTYRKNEHGFYVRPPHTLAVLYWLGLLVFSLFISFLATLTGAVTLRGVSWVLWFLVVAVVAWKTYDLALRVRKAGTLPRFLTELKLEKAIKQTLLDTMTVNRQQSTPTVSVPDVFVSDKSPGYFNVTIEKLPGMSSASIEDLKEHVTATFRGKLERFGVVSALVTAEGNSFRFTLEDVGTDKTWRPTKPARAGKYKLIFQRGLVLDMASRPHVAVWGKTGSGKSTVLLGLILQFFGMGADVRFIDGKSEFSSFGTFYGKHKIGSNVAGVVGILERVKAEVEHRQQFIAELNSQDGKMGRTAADLNYRPLVLLVDEIGAILATMAPKSQKEMIESLVAIIMKGRSVGVHVVLATQDPSTDTLPSKIRSQFSTRILLGSANQDTQRMAFGEVATTGQVEKFRGFYTCDGLTVQPMRFFVCDLHTYGLNDLTAFEQSYKLGSAVHYEYDSIF